MSLRFRAVCDARGLDVALDVAAGSTLALLGPNGSGKTSVLSILAGILQPDDGEALFDGRDLLRVPVHRRRVSLMTQDPSLFGHLSVLDNVAFGPRSQGLGRAQSRRAAAAWLDQVDGAALARRRPSQLSGGQAQRVALARALAAEPELVLLDEPLSALDVAAAARMRHTLRRSLAGRTAVLVTHDMLDAVLLADSVVVLAQGRVVEAGPAPAVMARPASAFAAGLFGWNMLRGTALGPDALITPDGRRVLGIPQGPLVAGDPAVAVFRPSAVSVHLQHPTGSPRNTYQARVAGLEPQAHLVRVRAGDVSADITAASVAQLQLGPGVPIHVAVKAAEVLLYRV